MATKLVMASCFAFFSTGIAHASIFHCSDATFLNTDVVSDVVQRIDENYESRCITGGGEISCSFSERLSEGGTRLVSMAKADANANGFRILRRFGHGITSSKQTFSCLRVGGDRPVSRDYQCTIRQPGEVTVGAQFALSARGEARTFMVGRDKMHCGAGRESIQCGRGDGTAIDGKDFDSTAVGLGAGSFTMLTNVDASNNETQSELLFETSCISSQTAPTLPTPVLPSIGQWGDVDTLGISSLPVSGFELLKVSDTPLLMTRSQSNWVGFSFDQDLGAWADLGSMLDASSASSACQNAVLRTENTDNGVYANLGGCLFWLANGASNWTHLSDHPVLREFLPPLEFAQTAIGDVLFNWGGKLPTANNTYLQTNRGFIYDPTQTAWREISSVGAPAPRQSAIAVAISANEIFVWGGLGNSIGAEAKLLQDGGIYSLNSNSWRPISAVGSHPGVMQASYPANSFSGKAVHIAWTGSEVLIYGGWNNERGYLAEGHLYNPATNTWRAMATGPNEFVFDGDSFMTSKGFLLWGGADRFSFKRHSAGWLYDLPTDTWKQTPTESALEGLPFYSRGVGLGDRVLFVGSNPFGVSGYNIGRYLYLE